MKYGSAIPLDGGGYAVMVICPNEGTFQRLKIDLAMIEPAAYAPEIALRDTGSATGGGMATHVEDVPDAPELTPEQEAMLERTESAEDVIDALNVDKPLEAAP